MQVVTASVGAHCTGYGVGVRIRKLTGTWSVGQWPNVTVQMTELFDLLPILLTNCLHCRFNSSSN